MNKNEKIVMIENMINEIIENAVEEYTSQFDENAGISVEDWKNGYKGTIRKYDGSILKYIDFSNFKALYSNFKYDLERASDEQLNKITKYLEEEKKYKEYDNLDTDLYTLDEF